MAISDKSRSSKAHCPITPTFFIAGLNFWNRSRCPEILHFLQPLRIFAVRGSYDPAHSFRRYIPLSMILYNPLGHLRCCKTTGLKKCGVVRPSHGRNPGWPNVALVVRSTPKSGIGTFNVPWYSPALLCCCASCEGLMTPHHCACAPCVRTIVQFRRARAL
jgi:hypothetical protein